jgi:hypothetical protein
MKKIRHIFFFLLIYCSAQSLFAQNTTCEATLDRYACRIGERCTLKLAVRYTEGTTKANVEWPVVDDSLAPPIEIASQDTVSIKLVDRASVLYEQVCKWEITCFDSGLWVIPPVPFVVNQDTVWTETMELYVNTVPCDTSKPIRPIAGIYDVPPPPPDLDESSISIWWWIGGGLLILAGLVFFFLNRKKKKPVEVVPQHVGHVLLPHERILQQLNEMAIKKPWRDGNMKGHYTALTELMRGWVVDRFHFSAMEMTTYQIMMRLRRMPDSGNKTSELEHVLRTADLVKFGKQVPDEYVNEKCIQHAIDFVMSTSFTTVQFSPPPPPNYGQR